MYKAMSNQSKMNYLSILSLAGTEGANLLTISLSDPETISSTRLLNARACGRSFPFEVFSMARLF